jgi:nucleotide-binding universal stress UspA family protein
MPRPGAAAMMDAMERSSLIVVGVDGSDSSIAAARWAAHEARLRGARLRLVVVWHISALLYAAEAFPPPLTVNVEDEMQANAERALDRTVAALCDILDGIEVERWVRSGTPTHVLCEATQRADLLVVGSRGHGGFTGLLLGSVSHQCAVHARCPVVIVRDVGSHEPAVT